MSPNLAAALTLAGRGWPVFPCRPGQKIPLTRHGCLDATTDEAVIDRWWRQSPSANVAIATGSPGPDVVDVDVKDGRQGEAAMNALRRVGLLRGPLAVVLTPSGGWHLYYRGSEQRNGKLSRHGVDFRGVGGYVVAPPSTVSGHPYVLLESRAEGQQVDWAAIRGLLDPPKPRCDPPSHLRGDLGPLARWVASQPPGNRNDGLFWAANRALEDGQRDLDPLVVAAVAAGLSESEARRTIASAERRSLCGTP